MVRPMAKWVLAGVVAVAGAGVLVWTTGCSDMNQMAGCCPMGGMKHEPGRPSTAEPSGLTDKPVNTTCPIMGGKVNPALTRQFKGQTIGFCCGMCPGKWDKLDDQDKQAKLDKA